MEHATLAVEKTCIVESPEGGSASQKSCAASATTLKILSPKRFRKPKKIIAPRCKVWHFEKYISNWLFAQTVLGYSTKPIFTTNYARNQISKQRFLISFKKHKDLKMCIAYFLGRRTSLHLTKKYSQRRPLNEPGFKKNSTNKVIMWW